MLKVNNLHAFYGKSHVLHGVDINVGEGEIVSLLGRNGVGRSTTVKAAMGQVHVEVDAVEHVALAVVGVEVVHLEQSHACPPACASATCEPR